MSKAVFYNVRCHKIWLWGLEQQSERALKHFHCIALHCTPLCCMGISRCLQHVARQGIAMFGLVLPCNAMDCLAPPPFIRPFCTGRESIFKAFCSILCTTHRTACTACSPPAKHVVINWTFVQSLSATARHGHRAYCFYFVSSSDKGSTLSCWHLPRTYGSCMCSA